MKLDRQVPSWSHLWRWLSPSFRDRPDRWTQVRTVEDFARLARRRTPRSVYDYVDGAAETEASSRRNVEAFRQLVFHPHVLRDVSSVDIGTTVLGRRISFPVVLGPTGFTRMMHAGGETAVARAAARAGLPYTLSTLGTTSIERLDTSGDRWFQLYLWKDRGRSRDLISRAAAAGYSTLVLTADVPVAGARLRDLHNGLTMPPTLSTRTLLGMARRPRWVADALTTEPLSFESLGEPKDLMSLINSVFEPAVTMADVAWLRQSWSGSLVVKGILRRDDARNAVDAGADGIAVSNHGGRQLDRAATPLEALPGVVDAVAGRAEVYLDGGVRSGADVAAVVALGARAAFVARPYLYALMAGGERGVDHLLGCFKSDYTRTVQLLGAAGTEQLHSDMVALPTAGGTSLRPAPRRPSGW